MSLFTAKLPYVPVELKDIWYPHFQLPARVNELGGIESTSPDMRAEHRRSGVQFDTGKNTPTVKTICYYRLLWECYNGRKTRSRSTIIFADGNPYNVTKKNLVEASPETPFEILTPAIDNTLDFWKKSRAEYESYLTNKKIDSEKFRDLFNLKKYFWDFLTFPGKIENLEIQLRYIEEKSHLCHLKSDRRTRSNIG